MLEANNAWPDLPTALLYCERYQKYSPCWINEPFSPDDLENRARLSASCAINVASGEIKAGRGNAALQSSRGFERQLGDQPQDEVLGDVFDIVVPATLGDRKILIRHHSRN